ncbi:DUF4202 family protein [Flavobacteriaceae bacterium R38]|nr:DUF4202 family protein [Flavobacteriaceae bacterium R38]
MTEEQKIERAFELFDAANKQDPNVEVYNGISYPKELLYAQRLSNQLTAFKPNASTALKLTARCQHICRWEIPRDAYEKNKVGYLKWREDLKKFHAEKAATILNEVGFNDEIVEEVKFLLQKKQLKKNADTQTLEDVICLVFLQFYFEDFAKKNNEEKLIDILQKTWRKMSEKGQKNALKLDLSENTAIHIHKALN